MSAPPPPAPVVQNVIIPNLPLGQIADKNGMATDDFWTFLQILISNLQKYFSEEGLVSPSQTQNNITVIQNSTIPNPAGGADLYTCAPGTFLYNSTNDTMLVSVLSGGVPVFKTITVT